jgi:hypothetical protein
MTTTKQPLSLLAEKAAALGCSFVKGTRRGAGYVLTDHQGDKPLGDDYTASLADVACYIENLADDTGVDDDDVEAGRESIKQATATQMEIKPTLDEFGKLVLPKPQTLEEKKRFAALHWTVGTKNAYDMRGLPGGMSLNEADRLMANARKAQLEQDIADGHKPDPAFEEKARQSRVFKEANDRLTRTNIQSRHDYSAEDYENDFYRRPVFEDDDDGDALPPAEGPSGASTASAGFAIQSKRQAGQRDHGVVKAADAFANLRRGANDRFMSQAGERAKAAIDGRRYVEAGSILFEAKRIAGHGRYQPWLLANGIHARTARRCLAAFKTDTDGGKTDTAAA